MAIHRALGEGEKVKEAEEGIKMEVVLGKEDSEEIMIILVDGKVGLDEAMIKEDPEGLKGIKEMQVVEAMEMVINQGKESIHLIRMG